MSAPTVPAHSQGHVECPVCDLSLRSITEKIEAGLPFPDAAKIWLNRQRFEGLRARTLRDLNEYVATLSRVTFSQLTLGAIHLGHIQTYREERLLTAGPGKINQEVNTLIRIKQAGDCWTPEMEKHYRRLPVPESDIPRALTPDEQEHWLAKTLEDERLHFIHWYTVAAIATTASTNEMRGLKLEDVNLAQRVMMVRERSAKNRYRQRTIPLRDDAVEAFRWLLTRAKTLGVLDSEHFIFPFGVLRNQYDPSRPMSDSGLKRPWNLGRLLTGLSWRPYDTRHTGCTRKAEAGVPAAVIKADAGHMTQKMFDHYQQISEQAQRMWGDVALARSGKKPPTSVPVEISNSVGKPLST